MCAEGSIVGSIGVLLQVGNINALLKKIGVNVEIIKSSKYKDMGSIFREMLPEEKRVFEHLINSAFEQFIDAIVKGRNLTKEQVMKFADGRIFIAKESFELQMIDAVGDEDIAMEELKKLSGVKEDVEILKERVTPFDFLRSVMIEMFKLKQISSPWEKFVHRKFRFEYIFE
ncbi:MAG: S49 family peptidase [Endomicrobia bacterium]|nr:S49 family peptidase [Endomicrobiia bacterium]